MWVDSDGQIDTLVLSWLASGENCMFPLEVGSGKADPAFAFRKQYGRDLFLMGGVSKHILAPDRESIRVEVLLLAHVLESGGFIPMPDHRVPPNVPFKNYLNYCSLIRQVWGR